MEIINPSGSDHVLTPDGGAGDVGKYETTINVTGNSSAAFSDFYTTIADGSSLSAGSYIITLLAEVSGSTIPPASAQLDYFEVQWQGVGGPMTTSISSLALDADTVTADYTISPPTIIYIGTNVEWRYSVSGWTSGACTLKLRAQLTRLC